MFFAREGLGSAPCISYWGESKEELAIPLREAPNGPPGQLTASRFKSDEVRRVAPSLANGEFEVVKPKIEGIQIGPDTEGDWCGSSVSSVIVVDDVAIVSFSSPGGDRGAHAFHRGAFGWRSIERVHLGWW